MNDTGMNTAMKTRVEVMMADDTPVTPSTAALYGDW